MLNKHISRVLGAKFADETRVPELAGHTQVFAAAHHGVGLTPFGGCRYTIFAKVGLLATCNGNQPGRC